MNKKSKAVQPLSENTRRAIIITVIIVVAVIILSVALALILKPAQNTPADNNSSSSGSSTLPIPNGDFHFVKSEETAYPKAAQNWTRYGYRAPTRADSADPTSEITSHGLESVSTNETALMGVVTTASEGDGDTWDTVLADLRAEGFTDVANPGTYSSELEDDNVFMIATKEATAESIFSDNFSVSSGKSVKITVHINTEQLADGSYAVIMIQDRTVSAMSKYWYAYNFNVAKQEGWQTLEYYVFNRETSSKSLKISIGLGNVYSGEEGAGSVTDESGETQPIKGEGILFVDDILSEEVTANDYRNVVDGNEELPEHSYKVIENEDIEDESVYLAWDSIGEGNLGTYENAADVAEEMGGYSPFTDTDDFFKDGEAAEEGTDPERVATGFTVYRLTYDGTNPAGPIGLRLDASSLNKDSGKNINTISSLWQKDHHHISFWVRADRQDNEASLINIYVQTFNKSATSDADKWEDIKDGSWTLIKTSQDIDTDSTCGWVKYDVYIRPSAVEQEVSVLVTFGNKDSYTQTEIDNGLVPSGNMYVTSPAYEKISLSNYNSASSGSYAKKLDLIGTSASSAGVTNGSFSSLNNTQRQPASWTGAFAGDSMLYRDGRGNQTPDGINRLYTDVEGSGVERGFAQGVALKADQVPTDKNPGLDDQQGNVLHIQNNVATSFGYYSADITLDARSVIVLSVYVKADGTAKPHFYLMSTDTSLAREDRIMAEGKTMADNERALGQGFASSQLDNGWTRQYIVVVTGNTSKTARMLLFNGSIDGTELSQGSVYFDIAEKTVIGTYATAENTEVEDADKYIVNWTMNEEEFYCTNDQEQRELRDLELTDLLTAQQIQALSDAGAYTLEDETPADGALSSLTVVDVDADAWAEMLKIPEPTDNETNEEETPTETEPVDLGLLFSVISSVALVAALLVVIVIKLFRNRSSRRKAA